jgi:CTP:molybdopterin cytidylyltransferase MocA
LIAAVILAAGAATRFGAPKQRLLLPRVLDRVRASAVDDVLVVAGAYPLAVPGVRVVECPDWERGMGASLRCGLTAIDRVVAAWRAGAADIVAASYGGERGHPVVLGRGTWGSIPDEGARALQPALVPCDDLGPPGDVDRADDMGRLEPPPAEI